MKYLFSSLLLYASIDLAVGQQQDINDGPYLFEENDQWVSYTVRDGELIKENLPENRMAASFQVATDVPGQTFEVTLKPGLGYELTTHEKPDRLVAISDIEGNFGPFRKLLQSAGVINNDLQWSFEEGHLVLVGDFFDRGSMVTEILWLIYKLEWEAYEAGGHIHFILGNHEILNLQGDFRYVNQKYQESARLLNKSMRDLYAENTELGQWLRTKNITEKIGDLLFVHAGFSSSILALNMSVEEINNKARSFYDNEQYSSHETMTLMSHGGPLWYRGYYETPRIPGVVNQTLEFFGVEHIITGHTVVAETITSHYNNRVINIDTHHVEGKSEALIVEDEVYYGMNELGIRRPLFENQRQ